MRLRFATDDRLVASIRRGERAAFEALYERHARELLSFCVYMLRSRHDAEDAVQATFASAYRALRADHRRVSLRSWLFTIARNECVSILRRRRETVELNGEPALRGDPARELELREEVRRMLDGLRELPERQRAALVLAELHGLSQVDIGTVLGVRPEQVKAYVYQARSKLISERRARETECREIREELATARGAALLRGRLRRHVRSCADCRTYADGVARQRQHLGALLPIVPSLVLKYRALEDALASGVADPATYAGGAAVGGSVAAGAAELAGGGVKALAVKLAAGVAALGASAGVGVSVLGPPEESAGPTAASSARLPLIAAAGRGSTISWAQGSPALVGGRRALGGRGEGATQGGQPSGSANQPGAPGDANGGAGEPGTSPGASGKQRGAGQQERQRSREAQPGKKEARQRQGEERQHKGEEHQRAREERQLKLKERSPRGQEERQRREEGLPPRNEEELQRKREERQRQREEHPPQPGSRPPKSEEQRKRHHEELEKRRIEHEERKAEETPPAG